MVRRKIKGRKAPTISATKRKIGTRMRGNDGKMWVVKKAGKSQRWMAGAESFGAEEYCRGCGGTTLPIVDSESGYCEICHERWSDEIHSAESFETELIGNNMPSKYNPYDYVADAPFGAEEGDSCPVCGCNTLLLDNIEVEGEDFSLIVCDNCEWFEELDFEPEGVPEYEDPLEEWMELDAESLDDAFWKPNLVIVTVVAVVIGLLLWRR